MNAVQLDSVLTSASTRGDNSLGLRFSTPELSSEEKVRILDLQGKNLRMLLQPTEGMDGITEVSKRLDVRSPSQRLRSALWHLWEQSDVGKVMTFEAFYQSKLEEMIEAVKSKITPAVKI